MRRVLDWAFSLWLVAITARYSATTWKTLHHPPFSPGDDLLWFAGWAVLCGLLVSGSFFLSPRVFKRATLGVCVVAAVVIFILSHTWLPAAIALWMLFVCTGIGLAILDALGIRLEAPADIIAAAVPVGIAGLALAFFVLSLAGRLSITWIACTLVAGTLLRLLPNVKAWMSLFHAFTGASKEFKLPGALIPFCALVNLTWAVAPEVQFDALNYHLAIPKIYLNAGGLLDARFMHAYLSKLLEFLFAGGLAVGGQTVVKLFVYALGLCAVAATYALGRSLFDSRVGMWAAALFYTTPVVASLTGTVYTDNIIALFSATGLLMFVKWVQTNDANWFSAISIVAGVAVGSKLSAAFAFLIVLPVMAFGLRRQLGTVLFGGCAFLLIALPTYAATWTFTGNPVFPLLNGLFKSPAGALDNTIFNASSFGLPTTLSNLALFPFRLTLDSTRFGEAIPRGALGLSLLLAFPFAVCFVPKLGRAVQGVFLAAFAYVVILFYTMQYARYYVVILPAISVLGAATVFEFARRGRSLPQWLAQGCLTLALAMPFPALTTLYWNIPERFPVGVAFGLESRDAFLHRTVVGYEAALYIDKTAASEDRILGVDMENLRFYLDPPLTTPAISRFDDPVRLLSEMQPGSGLAAAIRRVGFTRILVTTAQLQAPIPAYPYLDKAFLDSYAILEFNADGVAVYRVNLPRL